MMNVQGGFCSNIASLDRKKARMCRQSNITDFKPAEGNHWVGGQIFSEANNPSQTAFRPDKPFSLYQTNQTKTNLKMPNQKSKNLIIIILDTG